MRSFFTLSCAFLGYVFAFMLNSESTVFIALVGAMLMQVVMWFLNFLLGILPQRKFDKHLVAMLINFLINLVVLWLIGKMGSIWLMLSGFESLSVWHTAICLMLIGTGINLILIRRLKA